MAALVCDVCGGKLVMGTGGIAVCDSCGMEHSKDRMQEKVQEIKGTVAVSNLTHYKDIWEAAGKGIVQDVAYFIENGTDVNAKDGGKTPLLCALKDNSNLEVLKYLISKGANGSGEDESGKTPLHYAVCMNSKVEVNFNLEVIKYLISKGADVNAKDDIYGQTPLHYVAENSNIDIEVMKYLVSHGANVKAKDKSGSTLLHFAACNSNVEVLKYLISKGANVADVNTESEYGFTPLHNAAYGNSNVEVLKYLISKGANVNAKDNNGWTPLHTAAKDNPNVGVLKYLISEGANVNAKDKYGKTPLHYAKDKQEAVLEKAMEEQDRIEQERKEEQARIETKRREEQARIERERKEEQARRWREAGLCQYCGGQIGGIFSKKCKSCGKEN